MRSTPLKFALSAVAALVWLALSACCARAWLRGASEALPGAWAVVAVAGVALLPGYLACAVAISNRLSARNPPGRCSEPVTVAIYAHNAEGRIFSTIRDAMAQDYDGRIDVLCLDDASTDGTWLEAAQAVVRLRRPNRRARLLECPGPGRERTLNSGLRAVRTRYLIVMDAGARPDPTAVNGAIYRIVERHAGCALGGVRVERPRTWAQWMQACDCQTARDARLRFEGGYGAALSARCAFAAFDAAAVRSVGGWVARTGGDAPLICRLMERGWISLYEPSAVVYVDAPSRVGEWCRDRVRATRQLFGALRDVAPWRQRTFYGGYFEALNLSFCLLALAHELGVLAGVALIAVGARWVAVWLMLLALPGMLTGAPEALRFWRSSGPAEVWRGLCCGLFSALFSRTVRSGCTLVGYATAMMEQGRIRRDARKEV